MLEVGRDVLGGMFAVNGGGLAGGAGNVTTSRPTPWSGTTSASGTEHSCPGR